MRDNRYAMYRITGYAATWGRPFWPGGSIVPVVLERGAFSDQLAASDLRRVKVLWQHDITEPIGRILALREDERGLWFQAGISETERGAEIRTQIQDRVLDQVSIGFVPIEYSGLGPMMVVRRAELYEISLVTWAANPETQVALAHDTSQIDATSRINAEAFRRVRAQLARAQFAARQWEVLVWTHAI